MAPTSHRFRAMLRLCLTAGHGSPARRAPSRLQSVGFRLPPVKSGGKRSGSFRAERHRKPTWRCVSSADDRRPHPTRTVSIPACGPSRVACLARSRFSAVHGVWRAYAEISQRRSPIKFGRRVLAHDRVELAYRSRHHNYLRKLERQRIMAAGYVRAGGSSCRRCGCFGATARGSAHALCREICAVVHDIRWRSSLGAYRSSNEWSPLSGKLCWAANVREVSGGNCKDSADSERLHKGR